LHRFRFWGYALLLALVLVLGIVFLLQNTEPKIGLRFFHVQLPEHGLGFWILLAFLFGLVLGALLNGISGRWRRWRRSAEEKLKH